MRPSFLLSIATWLALLPLLVLPGGCQEREEEAEVAPPVPQAAPDAVPDAEAPAPAAAIDEATKIRFQTILEQVTAHIRNGELAAAETGLRELDEMSARLPEPMRQQIRTVRAALSAARAGAGAAPVAPLPATQPL